jgi:hypothetical protein
MSNFSNQIRILLGEQNSTTSAKSPPKNVVSGSFPSLPKSSEKMKTIVHEKADEAPVSPVESTVATAISAYAPVSELPPLPRPQTSKPEIAAEVIAEDPKNVMTSEAMKKIDEAIAKPSVSIEEPAANVDASAAAGSSKAVLLPTPAGVTASTLQTPILNHTGNDSPNLETMAKGANDKKRKASKDLTKDSSVDLEAGAPPTAFLG